VENDSIHLIRDIKVFANGEVLKEIKELMPGEKEEIVLPKNTFIILLAEAPFHAPATKEISLSRISNVDFRYSTSYPKPVIEAIEFELELGLCNSGEGVRVSVRELHDRSFFKERFQSDSVSIPMEGCKTIKYNLTPLKKGETNISFNISSQEFDESFEQKIEVR